MQPNSPSLKITFLGTGTSQGVPLIGCECEVCTSLDFRDKRLRSSVHIQTENASFVIDTGPDFRQQMLRERIYDIDALLFTHEHKDHTSGLDDVRSYNHRFNKDIPIYATPRVLESLKIEFAYAFAPKRYPEIPRLELIEIDKEPFEIKGNTFIPIEVMHYKLPVMGFRIGNFAYITDANYISALEKEKLKGLEVLVLNALQKDPHISHFTVEEAVALSHELKPKRTFFTHLSHRLGTHSVVDAELPENISLAYDGLVVRI